MLNFNCFILGWCIFSRLLLLTFFYHFFRCLYSFIFFFNWISSWSLLSLHLILSFSRISIGLLFIINFIIIEIIRYIIKNYLCHNFISKLSCILTILLSRLLLIIINSIQFLLRICPIILFRKNIFFSYCLNLFFIWIFIGIPWKHRFQFDILKYIKFLFQK